MSVSSALTTAWRRRCSTGNIIVGANRGMGGPGGAWCWLTRVFGIATKYAESLLAVRYRVRTADGTMLGGPMYALEHGLGQRGLAVFFAVFTVIASFGIGNMVQANAIATMANSTLHLSPWLTGSVLALLVAVVILGGVRCIARVCEMLVPFMAVVCGRPADHPGAHLVHHPRDDCAHRSARVHRQAAAGGFVGAAFMQVARYGIARGLFSNRSGLGSAPIVAGGAHAQPVRQALVSPPAPFGIR